MGLKNDGKLSKAKQRAIIRFIREQKRAVIQEDLDKSYEATDTYRKFTRPPWKSRFNVICNFIVPAIFTLLFQETFSWYVGLVISYFAFDLAFYAYRLNKWNRNVKKYGADEWLTSLGYKPTEDRK